MSHHDTETSNGQLAHFIDEGTNDIEPIVMLPGGSLNISYLGPLSKSLVAAGHRTVRIDAVHHKDDVTMHDLADDVVAVMDELALPKSWIAGHAFGNRVARTVALDYPDRVLGIILLAAGGTVAPSDDAKEALKTAFSDVPEKQAEESMVYFVGDPKDADKAWDGVKDARDPSLGAMQRQANISTPPDEWARISPETTAIIIQGSHDQIAPPANGEQLAAKNPDNTRLLSLKGAGHLFPMIRPDETAKLIVDNI